MGARSLQVKSSMLSIGLVFLLVTGIFLAISREYYWYPSAKIYDRSPSFSIHSEETVVTSFPRNSRI